MKAQEEEASRKLASVGEVEIKIRYPDQTQAISKFTSTDTVATLYSFVQSMLQHSDQPFGLTYSSGKGPKAIPQQNGKALLIKDMGFSGRMLINFVWGQAASSEARSSSVLKGEFAAAAKELKVEEIKSSTMAANEPSHETIGKSIKESSSKGEGKRGMPKWLKLGKK